MSSASADCLTVLAWIPVMSFRSGRKNLQERYVLWQRAHAQQCDGEGRSWCEHPSQVASNRNWWVCATFVIFFIVEGKIYYESESCLVFYHVFNATEIPVLWSTHAVMSDGITDSVRVCQISSTIDHAVFIAAIALEHTCLYTDLRHNAQCFINDHLATSKHSPQAQYGVDVCGLRITHGKLPPSPPLSTLPRCRICHLSFKSNSPSYSPFHFVVLCFVCCLLYLHLTSTHL